jgi:hypothetical protein
MAAAVALKSMLLFVILYHRFVILYHHFVILFTLTQFHGRIFSFFVGLCPGRGERGVVYSLTVLTVACTFANYNGGRLAKEVNDTKCTSFMIKCTS